MINREQVRDAKPEFRKTGILYKLLQSNLETLVFLFNLMVNPWGIDPEDDALSESMVEEDGDETDEECDSNILRHYIRVGDRLGRSA